MSCVRESSPQSEHVVQRPEPKVRRFNPLRRLRRIFRRKAQSPEPNEVKSCDNIVEPPGLDTSRSRSTSQLIDEPFARRRSLHSTILSVSHDSVFNPEQHSGQSDSESAVSVPPLGFPQANIQAELLEAVRRRRKIQDDDDSFDMDNEDLGLPRSPSMHSPTIATGNDLRLSKELITKSSHSTCSDGSLLSMGSSEMDEDSFGAHNSRYSSKISLHDKRTSQTHLDSSDGDYSTSVPLSHAVAKHRMAIRPKRKHGNPRSKKPLSVTNALPATPEVNEEHSGRSTSPETKPQTADTAGIYNYGQSYSAYYPSKFKARRPSKNNAFAKPKRKLPPNRRSRAFRLCGCLSRSRSGAYRVRNDTHPYFVRSSSVRPVGFNKISPPLSIRKRRQSPPISSPPQPPPPQRQQQQQPRQIDVTQGRIRLNLYAYPEGYLAFLESYFVCTSTSSGSNCGPSNSNFDDDVASTRKRLSAISEEDVCPLCGGSVDYATMKNAITMTSRWKNALLVPF